MAFSFPESNRRELTPRGASDEIPEHPFSWNRRLQRITVVRDMPISLAMALFGLPSDAIRQIRARNTVL